MESPDLEVVAFDDEQKFAVGRALMAVADQVFEDAKIEPITYSQDDVIELLSDSENATENENGDDASDCEMFGKICTNLEDPMENQKLETHTLSESIISRKVVEVGVPEPANGNMAVVDKFADKAIINSDVTLVPGINYKVKHTPNTPMQGILNEIIELDDEDDDDYMNSPSCNDGGNAEYSEDEAKEKKFVDLLNVHSDDDNQPSTSNTNMNSHNLEAFLNYLCPQCGVTCDNVKKWNAHTDIVHNFRSISQLNLKTVINREGQLCYKCNTCDKRFASDCRYGVLLNHRIQHMPIPSFLRCRLCQERFSGRTFFLKHFKKNHKKITLQKLRRTETIRRHVEFRCPICDEKADDYKEWTDHLEDDHDWSEKIQEKVTTIRDFLVECNTCAATFRSRQTKWHLLRHEKHKPFHCKHCKQVSGYDLGNVAKHIRVEHLNEKTEKKAFLCHYCDKRFETCSRKISHTMEMHTIEKLTCDVCHKKFNCSSRLLAHMAKLNHQKIK